MIINRLGLRHYKIHRAKNFENRSIISPHMQNVYSSGSLQIGGFVDGVSLGCDF